MEDGRYRVEVDFTARVPVPDEHDEPATHAALDRLAIHLPVGAEVIETHTDPATNGVEPVVQITARSPADALQQFIAALEHLAINVRPEHGIEPLARAFQ